ncbi:MAG: ComEC/Rec2 family competence protein [Rhizomicrobium sp.]
MPASRWRALAASALAERDRWPLWLPAAFAAGIGLYFALPVEPALPWAGFATLAGLAAALGVGSTHRTTLRIALSLIAALAFGFAIAKLRTQSVAAPILARQVGPFGLDGRVEQAEPKGKGIRMVLTDIVSRRFTPQTTPVRIRVSVRAATPLPAPGSWVHVTAVLMPPPAPAAPGAYDFGRAAYYSRLGAVGYAYGRPKPIAPLRAETLREGWFARLERLRNAMTLRIREVLPGPEGAIAAALITGERSGVDASDVQAYRDSGLMHVLSISGLHLALAGGLFFWVLRALLAAIPAVALRYPIKKWAALAALAGATFYLLISGCEAPAVRSWIMLALMFAAILFDRPAITMRTVAIAAALLLAIEPESLLEPGFEMSFAAVIALVAFGEWELSRAPRRRARHPPAPGLALPRRHRDGQHRRRPRHRAFRDLPFRPFVAIRDPGQSPVAADRRLRHHAGCRRDHGSDAVRPRPPAAARHGQGRSADEPGGPLGRRPSRRDDFLRGVAARRAARRRVRGGCG